MNVGAAQTGNELKHPQKVWVKEGWWDHSAIYERMDTHIHSHTLTIRSLQTTRSSSSWAWSLALALSSSLSSFSSYCVWILPPLSIFVSLLRSLVSLSALLTVVLSPHLSTYKYSHLCQTPSSAGSSHPPLPLSLSILPLPLMFLPLQFTAHTASKVRERDRVRDMNRE